MTEYLFKDASYRSTLINLLLDGKIKIDQQVCNCIYQLQSDSKGKIMTSVNVDHRGAPQTCDYRTTLTNLGYDLKYLGQGTYGLAAKVCTNQKCTLAYAIKVMMYDNNYEFYDPITNPNRPENIEVQIFKWLNQRILYPKISPHITLYIQDFKCTGVPALWKFDDPTNQNHSRDYKNYINQLLPDDKNRYEYHTESSVVLISELATLGSLNGFVQLNQINENILNIIIFQFVYTLGQIHRIMPGFRHNDCHSGNMLMQLDDYYNPVLTNQKYYIYHFEGIFFKIPVVRCQLKFWDFDFANIIGETNNLKYKVFKADEFGYRHVKNHYYDLHLFVNDLLMLKDPKSKYEIDDAFPKISQTSKLFTFLQTIVPEKYYGQDTTTTGFGRLRPDIELTTPYALLTMNKYFRDRFEVKLDQVDINQVVDIFDYDFDRFRQLVETASQNTIQIPQPPPPPESPKPIVNINDSTQLFKSICELPPKKTVYPSGICKNPLHHPCPSDSRWCYQCMDRTEKCYLPTMNRTKGTYSFKAKLRPT